MDAKAKILAPVFLGLWLIVLPGCVPLPHATKRDSGLTLSPDAKWVATFECRSIGVAMAVPPESIDLARNSTATITIRDTAGHVQTRIHYAKASGDGRASIHQLQWSPSSEWLAVEGLMGRSVYQALEIIDRAGKCRQFIGDRVNQFRWVGDKELLYVRGRIEVIRVSTQGGEPQPVFTRRLSRWDDQANSLSPDGSTLVYQDEDRIFFVNLANTNHTDQVKLVGNLYHCFWDSSGKRCLFDTLISRSSTTNYYARSKVAMWLHDSTTGSFGNLSESLPRLPGDEEFDGPRAFSANGAWFLLPSSGGWNTRQYRSRTWLVQVSPWALVDLGEVVGASFQAQSFSPRGDHLLFTTPNRRKEGRFDLFVSRVSGASSGAPTITAPRKIAEDQLRWLWYPDGKHLLVSDGFKFRTFAIDVP